MSDDYLSSEIEARAGNGMGIQCPICGSDNIGTITAYPPHCADCDTIEKDWQRAEIASLRAQLAFAKDALETIRDHEHSRYGCKAYGPNGCLALDSDENRGTIRGHRCAAAIAAEALKKLEE